MSGVYDLLSGRFWLFDLSGVRVDVSGRLKLPIDGVKIGTSSDRNQIQTDNGWKRDGMKGKNYLILSTKHKGKLIAAASYGPVAPNAATDEFKVLLKSKICMVDEG
jgi:hypothetical protein